MCRRKATSKWTINDGTNAAIVELCFEHSQPLELLMERGLVDGGRESMGGLKQKSRPLTPVRGRERLQPLNWRPPV
jgi:hypothetical protein